MELTEQIKIDMIDRLQEQMKLRHQTTDRVGARLKTTKGKSKKKCVTKYNIQLEDLRINNINEETRSNEMRIGFAKFCIFNIM